VATAASVATTASTATAMASTPAATAQPQLTATAQATAQASHAEAVYEKEKTRTQEVLRRLAELTGDDTSSAMAETFDRIKQIEGSGDSKNARLTATDTRNLSTLVNNLVDRIGSYS
jgi:hypothetical protein